PILRHLTSTRNRDRALRHTLDPDWPLQDQSQEEDSDSSPFKEMKPGKVIPPQAYEAHTRLSGVSTNDETSLR
ncbi:hypothetical protein L9F63_008568, partial [Diploptera punctata]